MIAHPSRRSTSTDDRRSGGKAGLEEVIRDLHARKVRVMLTGANERVAGKLRRAGIVELIGDENSCEHLEQALARLNG